MNTKTIINGHEIAAYEKAAEWKLAKHKAFEMCQFLHKEKIPWFLAFNVVNPAIQIKYRTARVSNGDIELWCKEAYALFEEG